ncbi:MAG TPA: M1 family metallopeptidase [Planctomycetota bacterium]|nr:M1 family metallopeptidase [Planctomycetota bacterium]
MPASRGPFIIHAAVRGLIAVLLLATSAAGQAGEDRSCRVDYRIQARADVPAHALLGEETILWRNESRDDVPDLWFHLYWNAFANNQSTHLREAGGDLGAAENSDEWGWQHVSAVQVDGVDVLGTMRWRTADDHNEDDHTVFSVQLPKPVHPGETASVTIHWDARIPRVRRRTGQKDGFLFIVQWFPKLGVYESSNGWNCHQFHANTEFFSDYGTYDVTLDLPAEYAGKIGASGAPAEEERVENGRVVARFVAPTEKDQLLTDSTGKHPVVHDFAWTADPRYEVFERDFRYDDWAARYPDDVANTALALGRGLEEIRARDVRVTVLLHPEHADQAERHFHAASTALFFYGLWFGPYPYEHVTVVDPAYGAGAAGGMEYPTLFTAGSRVLATVDALTPESVTVHECGHQFWYGLVGNNEFEAAWLDEGFNTFTQNEALAREYHVSRRTHDFGGFPFVGIDAAREPGGGVVADALALRRWSFPHGHVVDPIRGSGYLDWWRNQPMLSFGTEIEEPRASDRSGYLQDPDTDPVDTPGWRYADRASYRTNSYRRTASALRSLANMVGWEGFVRGMRLYSERWRYGHPYPQDFFEAFAEGAQTGDISWFFDSVFRGTATVDWGIEVAQKAESKPSGWFLDAAGEWKALDAATEKPAAEDGPWRVNLLVRRKGTLLLPLKLALKYADGTGESLFWSREEQARTTWWKPLEGREVSAKKLVSAVLDPDRVYDFDKDLSDNQWFDAVDERTPIRWAERAFEQCAHVLHWYGGLGG